MNTRATNDVTTQSALERFRTYDPPPQGFDPMTAPDELLRRHGFPRRPDPKTEPQLAKLFERAFATPRNYQRAELAIDHALTRRHRRSADAPEFGPSTWGGVIVNNGPPGGTPAKPATLVYADWIVPDIPADQPAEHMVVGFWVGLDRFDELLQAGIAATLGPPPPGGGPRKPNYQAWTEWWVPNEINASGAWVANFELAAGDLVSFLVCAPFDPTHGGAFMLNHRTNEARFVAIPAPDEKTQLRGYEAEWIVEPQTADLLEFAPLTFSNCTAGGKDFTLPLTGPHTIVEITGENGPRTQTQVVSASSCTVTWESRS